MWIDSILGNRHDSLLKFMLRSLDIKYTYSFLKKSVIEELDIKSSLSSISKIVSLYKIDNKAVQVEDKLDFVKNYDSPFFAKLLEGNVFVTKSGVEKVRFYDGKKVQEQRVERFINDWTGIALLVEKRVESEEPNYLRNLLETWIDVFINVIYLFSFAFLFVAFFFILIHKDADLLLSCLINIVGVFVCLLLLSKQLNLNSSIAKRVCTAFANQDGCDRVLNMSAAKFLGRFSWSEIGLGFFIVNLLLFPFQALYTSVLLINFFALPFTFWSIGYQKYVAKQWCVLCLIVQFVLWIFCFSNIHYLDICNCTWRNIALVVFVYVNVILSINVFVSFLSKYRKNKYLYTQLKQQSLDVDVFKFFLYKQPFYSTDKKVSSLCFGNKSSGNVITIVTNPFCTHCAELHREIVEYGFLYNPSYCVQYLFNSYSDDKRIIDRLLISLFFSMGENEVASVYDEWFSTGIHDPAKFVQRYSIGNERLPEVEIESQNHWKWFDTNGIIKTPIVLMNGYKLPQTYQLRDLLFVDL